MSHSNATQNQRILDYHDEFGAITQLEALSDLGIMRLASRISDLKKRGYQIESETIGVKNRFGETCHVKKYTIARCESVTSENLHIGTRVHFVPFIEDTRPRTIAEIRDARRKARGTVIYINTPHKYFTVEFDWHGQKMRESFKFCDIGEAVIIDG